MSAPDSPLFGSFGLGGVGTKTHFPDCWMTQP
jgi:hypothetical protein